MAGDADITARPVRTRMLLWALLIPLSYAPSVLVGNHPGSGAAIALACACVLAFVSVVALNRSHALDRVSSGAAPFAVPALVLLIALYVAVSVAGFRSKLGAFEPMPMAGLFGQSSWTQLHGHWFANSAESIDGTLVSHLGIHFSPTLLILVPFYALWPNPGTLLVAQALAVALTTVPLYYLLSPRIGATAAFVFSLGLLAVPNFAWVGSGDFRDAAFLPALLLATVWALENRRWPWFALFALASLGVREDTGLVFVALGIYALVRGMGLRVAAVVALIGLAWMVVITRLVMPHFSTPGMIIDPHRFFESMFGQWGSTPVKAARAILFHPGTVVRWLANYSTAHYLFSLLQPLLFVPPFTDWASVGALPGLTVNLFARHAFMRGADQPYSMVPTLFLALGSMKSAVRSAARVEDARRVGAGLAFALIFLAGVAPSTVMTWPKRQFRPPPAIAARAVVSAIPKGVPVYAPLALYPSLCNREDFDSWESTGPRALDPTFRSRYRIIALWPAGDPPGESRDAALADSLAHDPHFIARPGFAPFMVFEKR